MRPWRSLVGRCEGTCRARLCSHGLTWVHPRRYSSLAACEGQLHVSGADYQWDGEGWADTRHRYSHQEGRRTKGNFLPYRNLFSYDVLHSFHYVPCRCVPSPQRSTAASTTPPVNHRLHGRRPGDSGGAAVVLLLLILVVLMLLLLWVLLQLILLTSPTFTPFAPAASTSVLFLHRCCPDHQSRQQRGRVLFRLSSPSPWPSLSCDMR